MRTLYVIYDPHCGMCTEAKEWLMRQPTYVPLRLVPAGSDRARALYSRTSVQEIVVVSDRGEVWLGNRAWIVVLWALRRYRGWSRRLAIPALQPFARTAYEVISRNRIAISTLLQLTSEVERRRSCQIQPNE